MLFFDFFVQRTREGFSRQAKVYFLLYNKLSFVNYILIFNSIIRFIILFFIILKKFNSKTNNHRYLFEFH